MSQMQSEEQRGYGRYEGDHGYTQGPYSPPQGQTPPAYDENMVEAVSQRVVQLMGTGSQGKIRSHNSKAPAGMRLALAIVSLGILIPLAAITFGILGGFGGYMVFGGICLFILLINVVFNNATS